MAQTLYIVKVTRTPIPFLRSEVIGDEMEFRAWEEVEVMRREKAMTGSVCLMVIDSSYDSEVKEKVVIGSPRFYGIPVIRQVGSL